MSWSSGSNLFSEIIDTLIDNGVPDESRYNIYLDLIRVFEDEDCDTLDECKEDDPQFKRAFIEVNGPEEEPDETYDLGDEYADDE
ncbi:MAG: hypothetical protein P4L79_10695 [Legionella sp.]|uniref:hypothetical protein n=1 Tax=Legionella sp. TaxID=459 RepID=UPI002844A717|nr:hypothetical protein [Legionella sp.]